MTYKPAHTTGEMPGFPSESCCTDDKGNRVLMGLTHQETVEFESLLRDWWNDHVRADGVRSYGSIKERQAKLERRIALREKHDRARIQVLGAAAEKAQENPLMH